MALSSRLRVGHISSDLEGDMSGRMDAAAGNWWGLRKIQHIPIHDTQGTKSTTAVSS